MRFLCISDIHGHQLALSRVLADAEAQGFDQLLVCGDLCFPGPAPLEVWKTLLQHRAVCVQGVGDQAVAAIDPDKLAATTQQERDRIARLRSVHTELGELIVARLGKLPRLVRLPLESGHTLLMVHGSPADPTEPFTEDMTDDEMLALLGDEPGDLIVCGGSHVPFQRYVADVHVINVGSVGEAPGGGVAHGTLLDTSPAGTKVSQFFVPLEG
jgi:predicted phosphodiesterase